VVQKVVAHFIERLLGFREAIQVEVLELAMQFPY
jgi:hypothetical protein